MLNHIVIMGRMVADPELRYTEGNNVPVCSFRIACDRDYKDKTTGKRGVDFINCVAWRATAEFVSRYFAKGRMAVVEGRLQVRPFTDRDGNKRQAVEIRADNVYFGDSKPKDDDGEPPAYPGDEEDIPAGFVPNLGDDSEDNLPY